MNNQRGFASDNYAGIHPAVLEAIGKVNLGHQVAYGEDSETERFDSLVKVLFGPNAKGFPVFNGTGANVIALQATTKRWEAVVCVESAHIHVDEERPRVQGIIRLAAIALERTERYERVESVSVELVEDIQQVVDRLGIPVVRLTRCRVNRRCAVNTLRR